MLKKQLCKLLCIALFLIGPSIFAQSKIKLGVDAGYTYTALDANVSNLVDSEYNNRYGFGLNITGEYNIWKTTFVSLGISYLQKNYEFRRTDSHKGWYSEYNDAYLNMPLLVGAYILNNPYISEGVWLKVAGGIYGGYWLNRHVDGRYPLFSNLQPDGTFPYEEVSSDYDFDKNENHLARFNYGLQGQVQLGYSFGEFDVYASYNYQYELSDMTDFEEVNEKYESSLRSYMLSIGVAYKLNFKN